jgi:hypothetical protein
MRSARKNAVCMATPKWNPITLSQTNILNVHEMVSFATFGAALHCPNLCPPKDRFLIDYATYFNIWFIFNQFNIHMINSWFNIYLNIFLRKNSFLLSNLITFTTRNTKLQFTTALLCFYHFLMPWRDSNTDRLLFRRMRWPMRHAVRARERIFTIKTSILTKITLQFFWIYMNECVLWKSGIFVCVGNL